MTLKLLVYICLIIVQLYTISSEAKISKGQYLLNHQELTQLTGSERADYMEVVAKSLIQVSKEKERISGWSFLHNIIFNLSYAQTNNAFRCIGGGVPVETDSAYAADPKSQKCGVRSFAGFKCNHGQKICNPCVFGLHKNSSRPVCNAQATTSWCYQNTRVGRSQVFSDQKFKTPEMARACGQTMDRLSKICSGSASVTEGSRSLNEACYKLERQTRVTRARLGREAYSKRFGTLTEEEPDSVPAISGSIHNTRTCARIKANKSKFQKGRLAKPTYYITPVFKNLAGGRRRACINVEGSCIVERGGVSQLWNYAMKPRNRSREQCKYGFGNGKHGRYNPTNCLDPCRTIAAQNSIHAKGTVVYIPSMEGKICPQTGKPIDGCFVVGDTGQAIRGRGRFDFYTGECRNYNMRSNTCRDRGHNGFLPPRGADMYVVPRNDSLASQLRETQRSLILSNWGRSSSRSTTRSASID